MCGSVAVWQFGSNEVLSAECRVHFIMTLYRIKDWVLRIGVNDNEANPNP